MANTFGQNIFGIAAGGQLQTDPAASQTNDLARDQAAGSRWIRIDINWAQIQNSGPSSYSWSATDALVQNATAHGMQVLGILLYSPSWVAASPTTAPPASLYATFAGAAARHLSALGVHAYEIWNEENSSAFWTPKPDPVAYASLLQAAYPQIKAADPQSTVVTGGTSPAVTDGTNYAPADFLQAVYAAGGGGSFDAVGAHPYSWPAMPGEAQSWSAWYQMYGTPTNMRGVMVANGDGAKKIWGTEWGAPTNGPAGSSYVSETTQAQMVTQAYTQWSGYSWAGPLFFYMSRDLGTATTTRENFFGFVRNDGSLKPSYGAYQQAAATL